MIKNIVFDLGRVLIEFSPIEYLKPFGFDDNTNNILSEIIFKSKDWAECDSGKYANNRDIVEILCNKHPEYPELLKHKNKFSWWGEKLHFSEKLKFGVEKGIIKAIYQEKILLKDRRKIKIWKNKKSTPKYYATVA